MRLEDRKRQEICRAIYGELDQLLRTIYQHKTNPIELKTPAYDKSEVEFWQLPDELAQNIRKVYSKVSEANRLLNSSDAISRMIRDDLWYNYLPNDVIRLQEELKNYEAKITIEVTNNAPLSSQAKIMPTHVEWDLFICHASEDKNAVARPLAESLRLNGLRVWYDEFTLTLGDSLSESIDQGLAKSRFGVVILSPAFFKKKWPQRELNGLTAKEVSSGKVILPVWHHVTREYVLQYSPILADKYAVSTANGLESVVAEILKAISKDRDTRMPSTPHSTVAVDSKENIAVGKFVSDRKAPLVKIGEEVSSVTGTHQLSLTLLWWKESPICVNGPYASRTYYTFTAKPGMKFIIIAYRFRNNWIREQTTPYLHNGEITIGKGYIYSIWSPIGGVGAEGYNARAATEDEIRNLMGSSGASKKLLPEESCEGCVTFEIPKDATPVKAILPQVPLVFGFDH